MERGRPPSALPLMPGPATIPLHARGRLQVRPAENLPEKLTTKNQWAAVVVVVIALTMRLWGGLFAATGD